MQVWVQFHIPLGTWAVRMCRYGPHSLITSGLTGLCLWAGIWPILLFEPPTKLNRLSNFLIWRMWWRNSAFHMYTNYYIPSILTKYSLILKKKRYSLTGPEGVHSAHYIIWSDESMSSYGLHAWWSYLRLRCAKIVGIFWPIYPSIILIIHYFSYMSSSPLLSLHCIALVPTPYKGFRSPCTHAAPSCELCLRCLPHLQSIQRDHGFQLIKFIILNT